MTLHFNRNGSATFFADDGSNAATGCTGTGAQIDAAYATFVLAHPSPPPLPPTLVHALPSVDPGLTGALFITGNTLHVSQGAGVQAIQIGATGPSGQAVSL